jgi:hypothetical protein
MKTTFGLSAANNAATERKRVTTTGINLQLGMGFPYRNCQLQAISLLVEHRQKPLPASQAA